MAADIDTALSALRDARVSLFEACRRRDALLRRKPVPLELVADANEVVADAQNTVQAARELAEIILASEIEE